MADLLLILVLGFLALITVQFFTRGTAIKQIRPLREGSSQLAAGDDLFCQTFERLTNTHLSDANHIQLLVNGEELFSRLWTDLRSARDHITCQVFWFKPSEVASEMRAILEERARAGVRVFVPFDYFGSRGISEEYIRGLRGAGVEVATFRPLRWGSLYKVQQRTHVRSVVVDGRIGYTGGFGIDDPWRGDGRHPGQWRDTSVRLMGAVVDQLQAVFVTNWAESTGDLLLGSRLFALGAAEAAGSHDAGIMYAAPDLGSTNAERFYVLSISSARQRLNITSAYFVPNGDLRRMLMDAAGRGVDVRVLTPGKNTDHPSAWYASRAHYRELIEGGVRIYEYRPTMVHAKTLVADGVWSAIGTLNLDNRSLVLNDEVELVVRDPEFGREMEAIFLDDLEYADEVSLETLRNRSWRDRIRERTALLASPFL